jgi:hypothetical protein
MDKFQYETLRKEAVAKGALRLWMSFREQIRSLLSSYEATPDGRTYPASIEMTDNSVIVTCDRGMTEDALSFHTISIHVSAVYDGSRYVISVSTEKWLLRHQQPFQKRKEIQHRFGIDADPDSGRSYLVDDSQQEISAAKAAETVLYEALAGGF